MRSASTRRWRRSPIIQPTATAGRHSPAAANTSLGVAAGGGEQRHADQRRPGEHGRQRRPEGVGLQAPGLIDQHQRRPARAHAGVEQPTQQARRQIDTGPAPLQAEPPSQRQRGGGHGHGDTGQQDPFVDPQEHQQAERHGDHGPGQLAAGHRPHHPVTQSGPQRPRGHQRQQRSDRHCVPRAEQRRQERHGHQREAEAGQRGDHRRNDDDRHRPDEHRPAHGRLRPASPPSARLTPTRHR